MKYVLPFIIVVGLFGCSSATSDDSANAPAWAGQHTHTLTLGQSDNAEVVKVIGDGQGDNPRAVLVASKARKLVLVEITASGLNVIRERTLLETDSSESELTHIDVSSDGSWAVLTRTIITMNGDAQSDCGGELLFVSLVDSASFGDILSTVEVGPMPDSVDVSDDDQWVVSANERDGPDAWGKCEVAGEVASISVVDVSSGPAAPTERHRIILTDAATGPREPESVHIADNDRVAVTLQDSHELALFRISELPLAPTMADLTIVRLPNDALGAGPWPDGVLHVKTELETVLVVAGEWNDTLTVLSVEGDVLSSIVVSASDLPPALPRVLDEGSPPFSPDSLATFSRSGRTYVAVTLRHAGAVAVYDITDPRAPTYSSSIAVGRSEKGTQDEDGSTIRPEGIAASADGSFLLTANEAESSLSLIQLIE
ncbi:MAG: hypothetical protein ACI9OJ_000426 [Myxococcota bacterium]